MPPGAYVRVVLLGAFILPLSSVLSLKLQLSDICPTEYNVQRNNSRDISISVTANRSLCNQLSNNKKYGAVVENEDLYPNLETVIKNGEFRVNITWRATPNYQDKYPKKFILFFTLLENIDGDYNTMDEMCVLLRLRKRKANEHEASRTFYFDCLDLVHQYNAYLTVQVWSLPSLQRNKSCLSRLRRTARASNRCTSIECSGEAAFPLSKDFHQYQYCECYVKDHGFPNLTWSELDNIGQFKVAFTNFPPFSGDFEVKIVDDRLDVYEKFIRAADIQNGSFEFVTDKDGRFGPGNYSVQLYTGVSYSACKVQADLVETDIKERCYHYPVEYTRKVIEVTMKEDEPKIQQEYIWAVLIGTVVACIITGTVFILLRCRSKQQSISESARTIITARYRNNETETLMPESTPDDESEREARHLQLAQRSPQKMLLIHPDANAEQLTQTLYDNDGLELVSTSDSNWRDFAELALDTYSEIVIIVSDGLRQLCHDFKKAEQMNQKLLEDRLHENVPCVVLDKLRVKIQESPRNSDFSLHIVSLDGSDQLIKIFLEDHNFIIRNNNYYTYCFEKGDLTSAENSAIYQCLRNHLKGVVDDTIKSNLLRSQQFELWHIL